MAYTTINKSADYFNTKLYTGNSSVRTLTGVGFQPDFVWIKDRTNARDHMLFDSPRTATKDIHSNNDNTETTIADTLTAFTSDGFSLGADSTAASALVNGNSNNYVSWNWKGGTTSGISGGDITPSSYSFNTVSGFSVVKYTGNGSSGATVAHGLGVAPKMVMVKGLGDTYGWKVWHTDLASGKTLNLNNGNAEATDSNYISAASSTTFTTTGTYSVNENGNNYVAYCFAEKKGFSKIGSYTGNSNVNGPFIYCGFKPAFVLIKNISSSNHWLILDNKRSEFNKTDEGLFPNENSAEAANSAGSAINIVSNGFKIRTTGNAAANYNNNNGDSYIFLAFAEAPLVGSNNVTATAK